MIRAEADHFCSTVQITMRCLAAALPACLKEDLSACRVCACLGKQEGGILLQVDVLWFSRL